VTVYAQREGGRVIARSSRPYWRSQTTTSHREECRICPEHGAWTGTAWQGVLAQLDAHLELEHSVHA
jgi:hypothetical protein